tara:strand:+ start:19784 stop:21091 length:1308 start_codon:yes stop_codon:yes gene_type:complete
MTIIVFLLIISFLIFIHELGHLLAAKWANVKVENFSIGFGPKIFRFNLGETEYSLSLLPLGGYVKMQGENILEKDKDLNTDPSRSFDNLPIYKKQIILFAGPLMNLIVPFFLFPLIFINGIDSPKYLDDKMVIGSINTQDERLKQIELNSELVSINDIEIKTWENFLDIKDEKLNSIILIEYIHNNKIKTYEFDNAKNSINLKAAFSPALSNELGGIMKNSLAEINDFRKGDRIIKINNVEINKWSDIKQTLVSSKSEKFDFMIQRNDQIINKELVFKADKDKIIGISPNIITVKKEFSLEEVISNSFDKSIMSIKLIFNGITGIFAKLFSSDSDVSELKKNLAGPIAIAKYSGEAAQKGFNSVIQFIIIISVNLGIINLLPIPLLDGGHITINTIEGILRRRINPKIIGFLNKVGFALLISLMIFAVYNDIINF